MGLSDEKFPMNEFQLKTYLINVYIQIGQFKFVYFEIIEHISRFFSENQKYLAPVRFEPSLSRSLVRYAIHCTKEPVDIPCK